MTDAYGLFYLLISSLWLMLPVYTANNCATLLGGGKPLDGGKTFTDGRRMLGDHKTLRGFALGTAAGIIMAGLQIILVTYLVPSGDSDIIVTFPLAIALAMPFGALAGDAIKSFAKRRLGMKDGSMFPVADQLDFVIGALVFGALADPGWFFGHFSLYTIITVILITFPLQLFHNLVAVALGKKKVPW